MPLEKSVAVKAGDVRRLALSLPEVTEAPHFELASFRVRGKIFATIPPGGALLHVFVPEEDREHALALDPEFLEALRWGGRVVGLRVLLRSARPDAVGHLLWQAWAHKAPKALGEFARRVAESLQALAIPPETIAQRALEVCCEPAKLVVAETGADGRKHLLAPAAGRAWRALSSLARADGVGLHIVSAFRSVERQAEIVRGKLERGLSVEEVMCVSAPPGYSEHHTGRAVDVGASECPPLEAEFEDTEAFRWLAAHAGRFGFALSFPRGNQYGYAYEPWHWCFREAAA